MEKGKLMMIIIIVLLVVLLGTVAAVSVYVVGMVRAQANGEVGGAPISNSVKTLSVADKTTVSLGESITTNLAVGEDGKSHIAKILVSLSYDKTEGDESVEFGTLLEENIMVARTVALGVIADCTFEDLSGTDGRAYLSDLIKTRLQEEFNTMLITDIGFPEWLIP